MLLSLGSSGEYAEIDNEDYERVITFGNWRVLRINKNLVYAINERRIGKRSVNKKEYTCLHEFILDIKQFKIKVEIDHINGNGLNNKKSNLRLLTHAGNLLNRTRLDADNTSGVNGVYWCSQKNKWHAELSYNKKKIHVGFYADIQKAKKDREEIVAKILREDEIIANQRYKEFLANQPLSLSVEDL
jgi:hypothetical protein